MVLEENGGGDGNSSVAELEVRVDILEGIADDHETRISATESDVTGRYSSEALCFKWLLIQYMLMFINTDDIKISNVLILDLEDTVADQETRLTAAEENIQGSSPCLIPNLRDYKIVNNKNCKF